MKNGILLTIVSIGGFLVYLFVGILLASTLKMEEVEFTVLYAGGAFPILKYWINLILDMGGIYIGAQE